MNYFFLADTALFHGASAGEIEAMLGCLDSRVKKYAKGESVLREGERAERVGLVLSGGVNVETDDAWGNRSILGRAEAGEIFAEAYACLPGERLMVNVEASEQTEILFLRASRLIEPCRNVCAHHCLIVRNLLEIMARKNMGLSRRILHTSPKTIRGRLTRYLSEQARLCGSREFSIPFNRQQLADYLSVDRSALSNEISKMRAEGLIEVERSAFRLL